MTIITAKSPGLPGIKQQIKALQNQPANFSLHLGMLEGRAQEKMHCPAPSHSVRYKVETEIQPPLLHSPPREGEGHGAAFFRQGK